ncbi:MAG: hypothetical protein QXE06_07955 [Candidatus Bathyarchaeia archaeon]
MNDNQKHVLSNIQKAKEETLDGVSANEEKKKENVEIVWELPIKLAEKALNISILYDIITKNFALSENGEIEVPGFMNETEFYKRLLTFLMHLREKYNLNSEEEKKVCSLIEQGFKEACNRISEKIQEGVEEKREKQLSQETLRQIEETASSILNSEEPLIELKEKCLDHILVGEDENKLITLILLLGGKYSKIEKNINQIIILGGTSGVGKSALAGLSRAFKVKEVGRFTAHALDYTDLTGYEVLYIKEVSNLDQEKEGVATIKFLSTEDQGYTVEYVVKDEKGRLKTETKAIPPITVIATTTKVYVDSQFERRAWIINPDESQEQTKRILNFKAKLKEEEQEIKLGNKEITSKEFAFEVLKKIIEKLEPVEVIIPYSKTLTKLLNVEVLRTRGDYDKLYALVLLTAYFLQYKLPHVKREKGFLVVALPSVLLNALYFAKEPLETMSTKLDKRIRALVCRLKEIGIKNAGDIIYHENRIKLAQDLNKDERTIRNYLKKMVNEGYLAEEPDPTDKRHKNHRLLKSLDNILATTSGLTLGKETGNQKFPHSIYKEAIDETITFFTEKCGKNWIIENGIMEALRNDIKRYANNDQELMHTISTIAFSIFFDNCEVEKTESGKSCFPENLPEPRPDNGFKEVREVNA